MVFICIRVTFYRAGAWSNWNIQLPPWIPALAPQFTKPYAVDVVAKILSSAAAFYPEASWGLSTSNADLVRLCTSDEMLKSSWKRQGEFLSIWRIWPRQVFDFLACHTHYFGFLAPYSILRRVLSSHALFHQVQSGLYIAGGGNLFDWTQQMRHSLAELRASSARIATYIGSGNEHCGLAQGPNWYWTVSVRICACSHSNDHSSATLCLDFISSFRCDLYLFPLVSSSVCFPRFSFSHRDLGVLNYIHFSICAAMPL